MITLTVNDTKLHFEHSLVSLSEWEAEYEKAFYPPSNLTKEKQAEAEKTVDQMLRYFELMLVRPKNKIHLVQMLTHEQKMALARYIAQDRTATTVRQLQHTRGPSENVTSELIYYWFVAFKIPFDPTESWHLNRALTLVKICSLKNAPEKSRRRSAKEKQQQVASMREINERRLAAMGTKG